jgi:ketosteroid isomerase-like protein
MSEQNVELARQVVEAFNHRDLEATIRRLDPQIEWTPAGPAAVEQAVYRGREEVSGAFSVTWEAWELFRLEEHEVRDLGDSVLWLGRAHLRGGASQVELDQEFAVRFEIQDGKVVRMEGFLAWDEAREAAGLKE